MKASEFIFFPYVRSEITDIHDRRISDSDVFVDYFPALNQEWSTKIQSQGVLRLGYISIYKAPVREEVPFRSGFKGGAQTREEVEMNPYWLAVSIGENQRHAVTDEHQKPLLPFGKADYKSGWYQLCLSQDGVRRSILEGVTTLMDRGLDGLFIDNIVAHSRCHAKGCNDERPESTHEATLHELVTHLKNLDKVVALNMGRKNLFDLSVPADYYVIENFCYARNRPIDNPYFAGRHYTDKGLIEQDLDTILTKAEGLGGKLVAYTKTPTQLEDDERARLLAKARRFAKDKGLLWTTSLNELDLMG